MIRPDFYPANHLFLVYPHKFTDYFHSLIDFYDKLILLIPDSINLHLIINNLEAEEILKERFPNKNINTICIPNFDEIFIRDFMGFSMLDSVVKPLFKPDYCKSIYNKEYLKELELQSREVINKAINILIDLPLIWDGGNLITNGEIGVLTDKIIQQNSLPLSEIKDLIRHYLKIEPVIIKRSKYDILGHTDGYMSFIDHNNILVSKYPDHLKGLTEEVKYLRYIEDILKEYGLNIINIYDRPIINEKLCYSTNPKIDKSDYIYSARGCYCNFLNLNDTLIFPEYKLPTYDSKSNYNLLNKSILSDYKKVKTLNCDELARLGGVLRCISFTY